LVETLQHRQNTAELHRHLRAMHAADIAYVLEALPLPERSVVWEQTPDEQAAAVFVEVSEQVRRSLVQASQPERLLAVLVRLDPEDLAYVADSVSPNLLESVARELAHAERRRFEASVEYPHDSVGAYMTREWTAVPEHYSVEQCLRELRTARELPPQTDRIFVIDGRHVLRGTMPLQVLIVSDPSTPIVGLLTDHMVSFTAHDDVADAATAFERYDLVSAPVVDDRGKLVGRLTVDSIIDFVQRESSRRELQQAGLNQDEDLFASPWDSARNRWPRLALNLVTAFLASRVIGRFEDTIEQLAALAALMPIVASIGGNTGNQTMALVVRDIALNRIHLAGTRRLLTKELSIGLLNGTVWGLLVGVVAGVLHASAGLGAVVGFAVVLNLVVAALSGVAIPAALHAAGRDPAQGSSVLLTFVTDAMGSSSWCWASPPPCFSDHCAPDAGPGSLGALHLRRGGPRGSSGTEAPGTVRMTQIAPTFAAWLDVALSPRENRPVEALRLQRPASFAGGAAIMYALDKPARVLDTTVHGPRILPRGRVVCCNRPL
jgi:magnesium transporter